MGFKISSIGRGPDIDTVSNIGVYETIINHFLDLISKVFRIRDIMPHDLEILRDAIDMWSFQFRRWSTITPRILLWLLSVLLHYVR